MFLSEGWDNFQQQWAIGLDGLIVLWSHGNLIEKINKTKKSHSKLLMHAKQSLEIKKKSKFGQARDC